MNKLWTMIPNALLRATFLHTLYGWHYIPGIGSKTMFLGTFRTVTIVRRFCGIQPVQMHHPRLRRPVPSRQSACHNPLIHAAPLNRRIHVRSKSDEGHHCVPLELLLRHGHLSMFSMIITLDVATWRKCSASYALGASSISTKPNIMHEHIRTTPSCRLLFVLRTDMSMLLDSAIQHGIDGAHRQ